MRRLIILLSLLPLAMFAQVKPDSFKTVIKGTVDSNDRLYLYDQFADPSNINPDFIIPVTDNKFEFTITGNGVQKYSLCFLDDLKKGNWYHLDFFPDQDTVSFILYRSNDNFRKSVVNGGAVNRAKTEFYRQQELTFHGDSLENVISKMKAEGTYYTVAFNDILTKYYKLFEENAPAKEIEALREIMNKMRAEGTELMPQAQALDKILREAVARRPQWQLDYIIANPDIYSYSMFCDNIKRTYYGERLLVDKLEIESIDKVYKCLSEANPGHPYNERMREILSGLKRNVPGGKCLDFSAPDLDGKMHKLSDEISGKIAIVDLWASWCGSCRRFSMKLIPVYEKYKDKGFTVVGIAREYKNTDALKAAIKMDDYPWHTLVELNDRAKIWDKYGIVNGAGRTFLIDEKGTIVFVSPTVEQITEYLDKRYYKK